MSDDRDPGPKRAVAWFVLAVCVALLAYVVVRLATGTVTLGLALTGASLAISTFLVGRELRRTRHGR